MASWKDVTRDGKIYLKQQKLLTMNARNACEKIEVIKSVTSLFCAPAVLRNVLDRGGFSAHPP